MKILKALSALAVVGLAVACGSNNNSGVTQSGYTGTTCGVNGVTCLTGSTIGTGSGTYIGRYAITNMMGQTVGWKTLYSLLPAGIYSNGVTSSGFTQSFSVAAGTTVVIDTTNLEFGTVARQCGVAFVQGWKQLSGTPTITATLNGSAVSMSAVGAQVQVQAAGTLTINGAFPAATPYCDFIFGNTNSSKSQYAVEIGGQGIYSEACTDLNNNSITCTN